MKSKGKGEMRGSLSTSLRSGRDDVSFCYPLSAIRYPLSAIQDKHLACPVDYTAIMSLSVRTVRQLRWVPVVFRVESNQVAVSLVFAAPLGRWR